MMRIGFFAVLALTAILVAGTCVPPPADAPVEPSTSLGIAIHSPSVDRTVAQGTVVQIEWSAANLTAEPARVTLLAESRVDLSQTTLTTMDDVVGLTSLLVFEWDTSSVSSGQHVILARITAAGRTEEATASGKLSINGPALFEFTAPTEPRTLLAGETVTITWTASDSESGTIARIGIDLDENHDSGDEIFITDAELNETSQEGTIEWDGTDTTGTQVDDGTYFLFALIDDGFNPVQRVPGLTQITVGEGDGDKSDTGDGGDEDAGSDAVLGIIKPDSNVEFLKGGDAVTIEFGINDPDDLLIDLKLDTDDNHANGNELTILSQRFVSAGTKTDTFDWTGNDASGNAVPDGIYRLVLVASSGMGVPRTESASGLLFRRSPDTKPLSRQTWERRADAWSLVVPDDSPKPRRDHAMVFDAQREQTFLFGGTSSDGASSQNFTWDRLTWTELVVSSPPARLDHAMAYDAMRQQTVLFGGAFPTGRLGDTWEWDGTAWTQLVSPDVLSPPARNGHAMAYRDSSQRTILFGGSTDAGLSAETWAWDGSAWTEPKPANVPPARSDHAMAYDAERDVIVLFGGKGANGLLADTWTWNGSDWKPATSDQNPSARSRHAMAYDTVRRLVVLFGGHTGTVDAGDTWEWDGNAWTEASPDNAPAARQSHAMAYDSAAGQMVVFGGQTGIALIGLLEPATAQTVTPGQFLTIRWRDDDPTGVAPIRLTVDDDPNPAEASETGAAEIEILSGREATADGVQDTFAWQVPGTLLPGTYYIFAYINDTSDVGPGGHNSVAPAPFIILDPAGSN